MKVLLLGDSTAAKKVENVRPETGWGEEFVNFLNPHWTLNNRAINGRSTRQIIEDGTFLDALQQTCPNDYCIIQFGHNENKPDKVRFSTPLQYGENLTMMINALRQRMVKPVILSSIVRRKFENGKIVNTHETYPDVARSVAEKMGVPFVDMTTITKHFFEEAGEEKSKEYFLILDKGVNSNYPEGVTDNTHLSNKGARIVAHLASLAFERANLPFIDFDILKQQIAQNK